MRSRSQSGFTLLEILAAIAIFAVASVMAYGGLNAVIFTREGLENSYNRIERWQRGVHRMRADLEQVRDRGIRDEFGDPQPALWTPEDDRVEFTRGGWRNPLLLPRSSLERVAYYVEEDRLVRESWAVLDRTQASESRKFTLLEDIEDLRWRFLPPGSEEDPEWSEVWPENSQFGGYSGNAAAGLPQAVELQMETKDFGFIRLVFGIVVP